jgi:hypothetical protein|eukprot:COSAG02_NODE_104_length_36421_cov_132.465420_23_plen_68_part_00
MAQEERAATPFHAGGEFAAQVMELATTCFLKIVIRAKHGHSAIKAWLTDVSNQILLVDSSCLAASVK